MFFQYLLYGPRSDIPKEYGTVDGAGDDVLAVRTEVGTEKGEFALSHVHRARAPKKDGLNEPERRFKPIHSRSKMFMSTIQNQIQNQRDVFIHPMKRRDTHDKT